MKAKQMENQPQGKVTAKIYGRNTQLVALF